MSGDRTDDEVGPHQGQGITTAGADLADAPAAVVLAHGRGASARGILGMADEFAVEGVAYLAPQAARNEWYPNSFLAPVEANEPGRSSGLRALDDAVGRAVEAGIPHERIVLGGFSQGACLAAEYVARNPRRYGGVIAFSGGLIGEELDGTYPGDLAGTPVFLGCSDVDPHIPEERVVATRDALEAMGADVDMRLYEGMGHTVNADEVAAARAVIASLVD
ncbi:phospholipase [Haloglomus irregulare]|jgi:phospholipase/carboxylesterase|uniref:Phospholipase n=1 Tax=Haloglomus irregulare TaxID=2234134 RepID=A0A554NF87_9EURY|nr:dienelactone hydrolase family protein [Haloglomus irregulare]TSD15660.1 phospholipase [Haloglomus irregulare]